MALDNALKEKALAWVVARRDKARSATAGRRERWVKWYQHYRTYRNWKKKWPWRSKVFPPLPFGQVESVVPKIVSSVFGARPFIKGLPKKAHAVDKALTTERHLDNRFKQMKLITRAVPWFRMAPIYGSALAQVPWRKNRQMRRYQVTDRRSQNGVPVANRRWITSNELVYEGPWFESVGIFDWYIDPGATESDFSNADYLIVHKTTTIGNLQSQIKPAGPYEKFSKDELTKHAESGGASDAEAQYRADKLAAIGVGAGAEQLKPDKAVELLTYWGLFDINGDGKEEECIITVANEAVVIRCQESPYRAWPFVLFPYVSVDDDIYGIGILEPNESTIEGLLTNRNQRIDNVSLILNNMWAIHRGAHIKRQQLISRPGGIVEYGTQPPTALRPPDLRADSYNEEEIFRRDGDIGAGSGTQLFTQGAGTGRKQDRTLGEVQIMRGEGLSRIDLISRLLQEGPILRLAQLVLMLDGQFMEQDEIVRVGAQGGYEFVRITPEDIRDALDDVELEPTSLISLSSKETQVQKFILAFDRVAQIPGVNLQAVAKRLMEILDIKNVDEFFEVQEAMGGAMPVPEAGEAELSPEEAEELRGALGGRY